MHFEIQEKILALLKAGGIPLNIFDLAERVGQPVDVVQTAANELSANARLALTKKGKYALPDMMDLIPARASALRNGAPVAIPIAGGPQMKIKSGGRDRVLPEDTLLVRAAGDDECELVSITHRGKTQLPAFIRVEVREQRAMRTKRSRKHGKGIPAERSVLLSGVACDRRIPYPISVLSNDVPVRNDEIALLEIDRYPEGDRPMLAHVVRVLGDKSDMRTRLKVIAENHTFESTVSSAVEAQLSRFPTGVSPHDLENREDLRGMTVFTIDGPFSKDFDDAVSLEQTPDGDWQLGVHIADVSHYVRPGTPIDRDAFERGTSLYLPGLTVPMLPELLSNDLCSLRPDEDRLAMSLFMTVRGGKVVEHRLCQSVIRSCARLTYDAVNRLYGGDAEAVPAALHERLTDMLTLAKDLRSRRLRKGCIELELPETEFILDDANDPVEIELAERGEAERVIEDFMLAANETVAMLAQSASLPFVYRIHEAPDPDRIAELGRYLGSIGVPSHLGIAPHPGEFQQLIEATKELESAPSIRRMLLRSMQRAKYSERPMGHYALALEDYCHFTSPIRRYPDLIVHRMLKGLLAGEPSSGLGKRMEEIARQSSAREQEATLAERESSDLMKARYMQRHIGRKFDGVISGVTGWGLYVTLENGVEGLIHIASLDDYYEYDRDRNQLVAAGSRNVFRLGDRLRVRVEYVDLDRAEIDFSLLPAPREKRA